MEQNRRVWNTLETTVSYKARARLTPTLTHVVTYKLVTSGAEDRAMSLRNAGRARASHWLDSSLPHQISQWRRWQCILVPSVFSESISS